MLAEVADAHDEQMPAWVVVSTRVPLRPRGSRSIDVAVAVDEDVVGDVRPSLIEVILLHGAKSRRSQTISPQWRTAVMNRETLDLVVDVVASISTRPPCVSADGVDVALVTADGAVQEQGGSNEGSRG